MLYDIAQVDTSGRIAGSILAAVGWHPGDRLDAIMTSGAVILRASPGGLFPVTQRPRIIIPAAARHRHAIRPGSHVLVAAAPDYGVVIVYPLSALDEMVSRYHSAHPGAETRT